MRMFIIISVFIVLLVGGIFVMNKQRSSPPVQTSGPIPLQTIKPTTTPIQTSGPIPLQTIKPTTTPIQTSGPIPLQTIKPTTTPLQTTSPTSSMPTRSPSTPSPTPTQTQKPTSTPEPLGNGDQVCNYQGIYNYEFETCECNSGYAGRNCEFGPKNCNYNGKPVVDGNTGKLLYCNCNDPKYLSPFCCSKDNPFYTKSNICSELATCTNSIENGGWLISKKDVANINLSSSQCQSMCNDQQKPFIRMTKGLASCDNESDYSSDIFLQSLYYSPHENETNNKYWKIVETDRDLSGDRGSRRQIGNYQADRSQGKYGSFFIAYKFPDTSTDSSVITNRDLKNAIDTMFGTASSYSFSIDNYGNISINVNEVIKNFKNPLFPTSSETTKYEMNQSLFPRGNRQKTDSSTRYFLTDSNRKWILYNDKHDQINPDTTTPGQYYLLYNPIHASNFKKYYDSLVSSSDANNKDKIMNRMNNFLIKKYGELTAQKNTYDKGDRKYGDRTSRCTAGYDINSTYTLPDCSFDVFGSYVYPVSGRNGSLIYDKFKGQCACADSKGACNVVYGDDSYVKTYKTDIAKTLYPASMAQNGVCPSEIKNNFCMNDVSASGGNVTIQGSSISCNF